MDSESRSGLIRNAILIAGPTASGKSGLAVAVARRVGGVVVNADSMQVYSVMRVLTARPDEAALAEAPHRLYGHVDPASPWSTGAWLRAVAALAEDGVFNRMRPVFVGGTGLYFRALTHGLSEMPEVPGDVRAYWRQRLAELGSERLHVDLAAVDPTSAAAIRSTDGQRIVRALEVTEAAGVPYSRLRNKSSGPLLDASTSTGIVLEPDRAELRQRISRRIGEMVSHGVLDEVRDMTARRLDPASPALKAIGLRELAEYLAGRTGLEEAIAQTATATGQYAKRQSTWFRRQAPETWRRVETQAEAQAALS